MYMASKTNFKGDVTFVVQQIFQVY